MKKLILTVLAMMFVSTLAVSCKKESDKVLETKDTVDVVTLDTATVEIDSTVTVDTLKAD